MEYKKDFLDGENIPDFALKPAKPASTFDPTVYDKLFESMRQATTPEAEEQAVAAEVQSEVPEVEPVVAEAPESEPAVVELPEAEPVVAEVSEVEPVIAEVPEVESVVAELPQIEPVIAEAPMDRQEEPAAPVAVVVPVHMPQKPLPIKAEAASDRQQRRKVKYTDFRKLSPVIIHVEEDVLIPDTKPDMIQMLGLEGSCQLAERNVSTGAHGTQSMRVTGDLKVQALYKAENDDDEPVIVSLDTKLLFREDCMIKGELDAAIALSADVRSLEWDRINERKFRVRADVEVGMREYCDREFELFEGIEKEELQLLKDEIQFTDIAMRKTEIMEVSEEIRLKEGAPEIDKILCYNVNLVENHKQVSGEKAMINVTVYLNLLYRSDGCPVPYSCRTEFTQFIRMDEDRMDHPLLAGRASFDVLDCSLTAKRDEDGYCTILGLSMDVETTLEYYRQIHEPCIVDLYHYSKDVEYDRATRELNCFCGSCAADIPIREIVEIPDRYGKAEQVLYISGSPRIRDQKSFQGKVTVEGILPVRLICVGGASGKLPFNVEQELEFRASLDIPGCGDEGNLDCQAVVKNLSFDQINDRQIAVNAEIAVSGFAFEKSSAELIQTVNIIDRAESAGPDPSIIVYAAREGDTVWKVAKKYRAPMNRIRSVNDLAEHEEIRAGSKILIVK